MKFNIHQTELNTALQNLVRNTNTKFEQFSFIRLETKENNLILQATNGEEKFPIPCCFKLGYPPRNDKTRTLYANIICIKNLMNGLNTDLKINKPVYDIEFELIKE